MERVPDDKLDWKPHEKSSALGALAHHVSDIPNWFGMVFDGTEFDVAPPEGSGPQADPAKNGEERLERFDEAVERSRKVLSAKSDADFAASWSLKKAGEVIYSAPRAAVYRRFLMNHMVHHRGQLTVYLRLNDVAVPSTFGPTADEEGF